MMNPSKTASLLMVGLFLLLFVWWGATPTPASPPPTGLEGVRLLATNKVLNTLSTIQELFVPSINTSPTATPPPSIEPTVVPIVPVVVPPSGTHNGHGPAPTPPGRPDKHKDKDKHGNHGRGNDNDHEEKAD